MKNISKFNFILVLVTVISFTGCGDVQKNSTGQKVVDSDERIK